MELPEPRDSSTVLLGTLWGSTGLRCGHGLLCKGCCPCLAIAFLPPAASPKSCRHRALEWPLRLTLANKLGPGERAGGGAVEGSIDSINQRDCNQSKGLVTATTRDLGLHPAWTKEESSQKLSKVSTLPTQPSPSQH